MNNTNLSKCCQDNEGNPCWCWKHGNTPSPQEGVGAVGEGFYTWLHGRLKRDGTEGVFPGSVSPEEIISWIDEHTIPRADVERVVGELKELHRNSETRSGEHECSQEGYEYGLEDAISLVTSLLSPDQSK